MRKFFSSLAAGLGLGLLAPPASASQVVAFGYNMGVAPELTNAVAVGVRAYSLNALRADGTVAQWGNGGSDPGISNVVAMTSGGWFHTLGIRPDGSVTGWGDDLGEGISGMPAGVTNAIALAVGFRTSLVVRPDGTVVAWGDMTYNIPNVPAGLSNVTSIAAGNDGSSALALRADGTVWEWGSSGTNTHPELSNVVAIATANAYMNAAVHFDGPVTLWPTNEFDDYSFLVTLTNIVAVAGGGSHMLALRENGTVAPWGCDCRSDFASTAALTNVTVIAAGGGDGYDYSIFLIGHTNPPPALSISRSNNAVRLTLNGLAFRRYVIEQSNGLDSPPVWSFKQNVTLPASAQTTVEMLPTGAACFYRARLMP